MGAPTPRQELDEAVGLLAQAAACVDRAAAVTGSPHREHLVSAATIIDDAVRQVRAVIRAVPADGW